MDKQKSGRRIVSREEYLRAMGKKIVLSTYGVGIVLIGLLTLIATGWLISWASGGVLDGLLLFLVIILGLGSVLLLLIGKAWLREATQIDAGILLTRTNAVDLPAEETLVRASTQPVEKHRTVLLRAAFHSDTTPEEQLVRPVGMAGE